MPTKPLPAIFESKTTINDRVTLFMNGKHALLTDAMQLVDSNREETRWVWYSKENVQTWLDEMDDLDADGLRIYFGTKEIDVADEESLTAQAAKAAGQLCLVMVLTREGSYTGSHVNIDYEDEPDFTARQALSLTARSTEADKQFNFGGYCPPMSVTEGSDYPIVSLS